MRISDHAFNRLSVLKKLRAAEPVSRTALARLTGLNGSTITSIVRDLIARGLIVEEQLASPGRGRPRINLRINPEGAFVVGATMTDDGVLLAGIADLRGHIISSHRDELNPNGSLKDLAQEFAEVIAKAIAASPIPAERVAQIGIGLPAIVDSRNGTVEHLETFTDAPFPFALTVERKLGIPTRIDNSINLLARAEHWFGDGTGVDDFMVVLLDLGIGAARYHEGQLLLGSHGIAAELGHTKIVPEGGRPCGCGADGCLQAYSSISAIVNQAAEIAGEARPRIPELRDRFTALIDRARSGDGEVVDLISRGGRYLGRALANHINMRAPDRIIVLVKNRNLVEFVSGPFFEALHRDTLPLLRDRSRVTFKETDDSAFARGAAAMVLERLYRSQ